MENKSTVYVLVLAGLSDLPSLQFPLFLVFLLIYLITLTGNLLILLLIFTDSHLHTPMYFFLGTLACLDMSLSSVTVPRMLFDLLTKRRVISVPACITQIYFFLFFCTSEMAVLAVMSYDRYIAICRPLHYMQIMTWNVCVQFVSIILVFGAVHSLVHAVFLTKLTFCNPNDLQSFFCDLPQLLEASCSDTFLNILLIFLLGIFTVLKIPSKHTRSKAFSTCSSHLTVVFLFYTTTFFNYLHSKTNDHHTEDKVASVFYAILTPFLNPLIYSLRNQELKASVKRTLQRLQIKIGQKNYVRKVSHRAQWHSAAPTRPKESLP
uniref:Olfactory receptor n=1 Tax=Xenopus tropicalis TaxID=8364 RepID=K9J843_XENTR